MLQPFTKYLELDYKACCEVPGHRMEIVKTQGLTSGEWDSLLDNFGREAAK